MSMFTPPVQFKAYDSNQLAHSAQIDMANIKIVLVRCYWLWMRSASPHSMML